MNPPRAAWLPYAAVATTLVLWASAFVAIRHLAEDFSPGPLSLGRHLVAALALGLAVSRTGMRMPRPRDWPVLLAIGVLWFAVYHVALNEAEQRLDAGTASMLIQLSPVLLTVLAIVALGEPATRNGFVGLAVAFLGVVLIGLSTSGAQGRDVVGVVLCLVAALAYAVSVVLQKPLLRRIPALPLTWVACTIGAAATLPFLGTLATEVQRAPASSVGWLVYLGVFPTAVAFTTYAYGLSHLSASTMGMSTYLVPPITIAIAWLLLGEVPAPLAYAGGALCLLGVWWTRRRPGPAPRPAEPQPGSTDPRRSERHQAGDLGRRSAEGAPEARRGATTPPGRPDGGSVHSGSAQPGSQRA